MSIVTEPPKLPPLFKQSSLHGNRNRRHTRTSSTLDRSTAEDDRYVQENCKPSRGGRPVDPCKKEHRKTVQRMHDKINFCLRPCRVREVFRRFDSNRDGRLPVSSFKAALQHMHLVISEEETHRIIASVPCDENGEIEFENYLDLVLNEHALGQNSREESCHNVLVAAPWETVNGDFSGSATSGKNQPIASGTSSHNSLCCGQEGQDGLLKLMSAELRHCGPELIDVFRNMESSTDKELNRESFVEEVQSLKIAVDRPQIEEFYDATKAMKGSISIKQFQDDFDPKNILRKKRFPPNFADEEGGSTKKTQTSEDCTTAWDRSPRLRNLRDILYRRAGKALDIFRMRDTNMDGHLSIKEMCKICTELEPQLEHKELAENFAGMNTTGNGSVAYRDFLKCLCSSPACHGNSLPRLNLDQDSFSGRGLRGDSCFFNAPPPLPQNHGRPETNMMKHGVSANEHHNLVMQPLLESIRNKSIGHSPGNSSSRKEPVGKRKSQSMVGRYSFTPAPRDTWDITKAQVYTSGYMPESETFKRKQNNATLDFQQEDRKNNVQRFQASKTRVSNKTSFESERSERDQYLESNRTKHRLESLAHQKKKYSERMCMYNKLGGLPCQSSHNLFGVCAI